MKKCNCYYNKRNFGKSYVDLEKEIDLMLKEFTDLANSYTRTLECLNEDFPLFTTVCLSEIAFHVKNVKRITRSKKKTN